MALVVVVPLVVNGVWSMRIAAAEAEKRRDEVLVREAVTHATFTGSWLLAQDQTLLGAMRQYRLSTLDGERLSGFARGVFLSLPAAVTVAVVDRDKRLLVPAVYLEQHPAPGDLLEHRQLGSAERARALVERAVLPAAGRAALQVGEPYLPEGGDVPVVPLAVVGPFGEDVVVLAEISLDTPAQLLAERASEERAVALLRGDGRPVVGSGHALLEPDWLRSLLGTEGVFSHPLADGSTVRGARAPVQGTTWTVAVVEPADVAQAASRQIRNQLYVFLAVFAAAAVLAAVLVARYVARRVRVLRDAALDVAEGEYGRQIPGTERDELGELADAFNHMSSRLRENQVEIEEQRDEIEAFNRELQDRVEERTQELRRAQQQLVRSGQLAAVAEVGAGLAHELNNPLAGILGLTQVLRAQAEGTPQDGLLGQVELQAERCREVVDAMLRFNATEVDPQDAPVIDLSGVLRDAVGLVGGSFRHRGVSLVLAQVPEALPVRLDPVRGSRLVTQILNVLKAGLDPGARLDVSAGVRGDEVHVRFQTDRPVAVGGRRDDFMASSVGLWVARQALDESGGRLDPPDSAGAWTLCLPRVGSG